MPLRSEPWLGLRIWCLRVELAQLRCQVDASMSDKPVAQVQAFHLHDMARVFCTGSLQVHKGFLRAFDSVTDTNNATYNIAAVWQKLTGIPASAVTSCALSRTSQRAWLAVSLSLTCALQSRHQRPTCPAQTSKQKWALGLGLAPNP